jgi:hypothetical protein
VIGRTVIEIGLQVMKQRNENFYENHDCFERMYLPAFHTKKPLEYDLYRWKHAVIIYRI